MRVGRVSIGYGTSVLWHDPDYALDRPTGNFRVQKALDTELPYQEHIPPPKPEDPYSAQEKGYDVAFQQMTRGIEGRDFLHGTRRSGAFDAAVQAQAVLNSQRPQNEIAPDHAATERAVEKMREIAPPIPGQIRPQGASKTAGEAEHERTPAQVQDSGAVSDALSLLGGAAGMAAAGAVQAKAAEMAGSQALKAAISMQAVVNTGASATGQAHAMLEKQKVDHQAQQQQLRADRNKDMNFPALEPPPGPVQPTLAHAGLDQGDAPADAAVAGTRAGMPTITAPSPFEETAHAAATQPAAVRPHDGTDAEDLFAPVDPVDRNGED